MLRHFYSWSSCCAAVAWLWNVVCVHNEWLKFIFHHQRKQLTKRGNVTRSRRIADERDEEKIIDNEWRCIYWVMRRESEWENSTELQDEEEDKSIKAFFILKKLHPIVSFVAWRIFHIVVDSKVYIYFIAIWCENESINIAAQTSIFNKYLQMSYERTLNIDTICEEGTRKRRRLNDDWRKRSDAEKKRRWRHQQLNRNDL